MNNPDSDEERSVPDKNKPVVLVVDDSRAIRVFVRELLESEGYTVFEAVDGEDGISTILSSKPDILLLDLEMPVKNGLELLSEIDAENRLFSIIIFTTLSNTESIVEGLERGADDYIVKPFKDAELIARVSAALRTSRAKKMLDASRKRAEETLSLLEEAQNRVVAHERIHSVATLAAGAAHQINNPLGFIISNIGSLGRYAKRLLEAFDELSLTVGISAEEIQKRHKINRIRIDMPDLVKETQEGLDRIKLIVSGLAKLEAGLTGEHFEILDINSIVSPLIPIIETQISDRIKLEWKPSDLPLLVKGCLPLLNNSIMAILANAAEGVDPSGGKISVSTAVNGNNILITVCNTILKAPDYDPLRWLEPFSSEKRADRHCGLGLTIAERFIQSHSGEINVSLPSSSEVCVTISIPATRSASSVQS